MKTTLKHPIAAAWNVWARTTNNHLHTISQGLAIVVALELFVLAIYFMVGIY